LAEDHGVGRPRQRRLSRRDGRRADGERQARGAVVARARHLQRIVHQHDPVGPLL
jgi:hypothetical protein